MSDTLGTNQTLTVGQTITSANGNVVLTMQPDGNLVLTSNSNKLWSSGTTGATQAKMEWDGRLHVDDASGKWLWESHTPGHKDANLKINNDGGLFIWDGTNHQIWDSQTSGNKVNPKPGAGAGANVHKDFGGVDKFLKEAANVCGDIMKIVGPIAAVVVNIIPGIGQAASLAICAGIAAATAAANAAKAVANGDKNALASVAGAVATAIPGGDDPTVQAAITVGANAVTAAATGGAVDTGVLMSEVSNIASTSPQIKAALNSVTSGLASGSQIDSPELAAAMKLLPPNVQGALKIGTMTGNSAVVNAATTPSATVLTALQHLGQQTLATNPIAAQARTLAGTGTNGFDTGLGVLFNKISPSNLNAIRNTMAPADMKGFDMALATHMGNLSDPTPPGTNPTLAAGHAITMGMKSAPTEARVSMMKNIASHPVARQGAVKAVKTLAAKKEGWFHRLLHALGFIDS